METSQEFMCQLSAFAPDFPHNQADPPFGSESFENPIYQSVDLQRDFQEDVNVQFPIAMARGGSAKSLSAAAFRESFESMDLDQLEIIDYGNMVSSEAYLKPELVMQDGNGMPLTGPDQSHQDVDHCLGSAANQLPSAKAVAEHSALLGNVPPYYPTESDTESFEAGTEQPYQLRHNGQTINSESWSPWVANVAESTQPGGLGIYPLEQQQQQQPISAIYFWQSDDSSDPRYTSPLVENAAISNTSWIDRIDEQPPRASVGLSTLSATEPFVGYTNSTATVSSIPVDAGSNSMDTGPGQSAPFLTQQQPQQQDQHHRRGIANIENTFEHLAPMMTREPQVLWQLGSNSSTFEALDGSVLRILPSRKTSVSATDEAITAFTTDSNQMPDLQAEIPEPLAAATSQRLESQIWTAEATGTELSTAMPPAPPVVFPDDDEDPLLALFSSDYSLVAEEPLPDAQISVPCDAVDHKVERILEAISLQRGIRRDALTKHHVLVHEVVHIILLSDLVGCEDLKNILRFCTDDGFEQRQVCSNFMVRDTKVMGLIWKKLKGNTNGEYDTFARAMRTCREKQKGYFGYLDEGKGKRKRIYKLGGRSLREIDAMAKSHYTLRIN